MAQSVLLMTCLLMQDRIQALQDQQPERDRWCVALLGKEAFQLWDFKTDRRGGCLQCTKAPLYPFSPEIESRGFRMFVGWLTADLKVGRQPFPRNRDALPAMPHACHGLDVTSLCCVLEAPKSWHTLRWSNVCVSWRGVGMPCRLHSLDGGAMPWSRVCLS